MQPSGRARITDTGRHHLVARRSQPSVESVQAADDEDTGFDETVFAPHTEGVDRDGPPEEAPGGRHGHRADPDGPFDSSIEDTVRIVDPAAEAETTVLAAPDVVPWPHAAERRRRAHARTTERPAHAPLPLDTIIHLIIIGAAWALAIVVTVAIAGETKIGPVVVRFTATHGLHEGDVSTALMMAGGATAVTIVVAIRHWYIRWRRR